MGQHAARRHVRFFCPLRAGWLVLALGAAVILVPAVEAQVRANGYLSFAYEKGEGESDFPGGTFRGSQAGLLVAGRTGSLFSYGVEVRLSGETKTSLEEAWLAFQPWSGFSLRAGLFLVPFGKYNRSHRPHETPFIQPPLHLEALYPASWRDLGLVGEGHLGAFNYSIYLGNGLAEAASLGQGQQFEDNNSNKAAGGRASIFLSQSFELGGSYYQGKVDQADRRFLRLQGIDVTWQSDVFLFLYEYGKAVVENPEDYRDGESEGHFLLLSLKIRGLSPLVSYQTLRIDDPYHGPGFEPGVQVGAGLLSRVRRWAVGLTYSPALDLFLKLEYDFNREDGENLQNDVFRVQLALRF